MRRLFIAFAVLLLFVQSCSLSSYTLNLDRKIRKLELGMDKTEVFKLIGSNYKLASAVVLEDNAREEVLQYEGDSNGVYDLVFRDAKLVEWLFVRTPVKPEAKVTVVNKTED